MFGPTRDRESSQKTVVGNGIAPFRLKPFPAFPVNLTQRGALPRAEVMLLVARNTAVNRCTCPVRNDSPTGALQACLTLPFHGMLEIPSQRASYKTTSLPPYPRKNLMCSHRIYLKTFDIQGRFNVVIHYTERGRLPRDTGKNLLGETGGHGPGSVLRVMRPYVGFTLITETRRLELGPLMPGGNSK